MRNRIDQALVLKTNPIKGNPFTCLGFHAMVINLFDGYAGAGKGIRFFLLHRI